MPNGERYEGGFKDGKKEDVESKGEYFWPDGSHFKGNWKDNFQNGFGVLEQKNLIKYIGNWKDGK